MEDMDMSSESFSQRDKKISGKYRSELPNEIIEEQTKKIPNLVFLGLALASMAASAALTARKQKVLGNFVGLWAPAILSLGLYNKLVKMEDELLRNKLH